MRTYGLIALLLAGGASDSVADAADAGSARDVERPALVDVELSVDGSLHGQLVDPTGQELAGQTIIFRSGKSSTALQTDESGRFVLPRSCGGICILQIDDGFYGCRIWHHGTAPPGSMTGLTIVATDEPVIRGNDGRRSGHGAPWRASRLTTKQKYGLTVLALGGTVAYMALSRDNASE